MSTWIQSFLTNINSIDLSEKRPQKKLDKGETVLGELSEYLQKLHCLCEESREVAEGFRDRIEDIKAVHATEFRLGISNPKKHAEHVLKIQDLFDQFKAVFMPYITINHLFNNELEYTFFLELTQFPVTGIREGKFLIGRNDNARSDEDGLDEFFSQIEMILDLERAMKEC